VGPDPPTDRTARDVETFRDLGDREEFDLIVVVSPTIRMAECSRSRIAVAGGLSS
jgi:hypothetical protein